MSLKGGHPIPLLQSLVFSSDSRRLAAVCRDGAIRIWNLPAGSQALTVPVRLNEETLKDPLRHPLVLAFSPDGRRIALAGAASEKPNATGLRADNLVVWDAFSGKELLKVSDTGRSLVFNPDGKRIATSRCVFVKVGTALAGPFTEGMRILDADAGRELVRFAPFAPGGLHTFTNWDDCHLTYSPNGKWLASARGKEIKIWDATDAKELRTLQGHERPVTRLFFSADGKRLVSASRDETVRIWDPQRADALVVYRGHVGAVAGVCFQPDGKAIASTGEDHTVRIWSATAEQGPRDIPGTGALNESVAVSPDGHYVACVPPRGPSAPSERLVLVDALDGRQVRVLRACPDMPDIHASLVFSSDGRLLASALEKDVQIWDVATGQELAHFAGLCDYEQRGLALSRDGARLAFTAPENTVEVRDIRHHKRLTRYTGHKSPVTTIAFSPHGERVASGSTDGTVQVWEAANGQRIHNLKGTSDWRASAAFSPDGTRLLASTSDNAVSVWDLDKGKEVHALRGHKASVSSIAFNPTGTRLVTAGKDFMTRLWTWPECEEILTLPVRVNPVFVGFTTDGTKLVTVSDHGVTVWDAAPSPASDSIRQ
jgi:WD40 repeat protein